MTEISVVTVTISQNDKVGHGECRPYSRYNESPDSVIRQIEDIRQSIEQGITTQDLQQLLPAGAARNAVDCALWDLTAKLNGKPVSKVLGMPNAKPRQTAYTLSIDSPQKMRKAALEAHRYPLLKVKIGGPDGLSACLAIMDARPDAELIIDANEALDADALREFQQALKDMPVVMIEQPLPQAQDEQIPHHPNSLPIFCADESLHTSQDLDRLWRAGYRAINVKLDKCGGFTAGIALMQAAKAKGFIIMAGCMVGTSLAMAPIMILEGLADYIDLDGPLLLARDRKNGLRYDGPIVHPPSTELWG